MPAEYDLVIWILTIFLGGGFDYLATTKPKIISWTWAAIVIRKTIMAAGIFLLAINHMPVETALTVAVAPIAVLCFIRILILLTKNETETQQSKFLTHDAEEVLRK